MELTPDILQPLGVSAVLAWFLFLAWKRLAEKDKDNKELTQQLMDKYEENTRISERQSQALVQNTKATEKLVEVQQSFLSKLDNQLRDNT